MSKEWFDIPGYEGSYQANRAGKVRSLNGRWPSSGGRVLAQTYERYRSVCLCRNGRRKKMLTHRIIALTFHGCCPEGKEVAHLDGNRWNNRADNLAYVSRKENHSHKAAHGTDQIGSRHPRAKLTEANIKEIRARFKRWSPRGSNSKQLAECYGVSRSLIINIVNGKGWEHVQLKGETNR